MRRSIIAGVNGKSQATEAARLAAALARSLDRQLATLAEVASRFPAPLIVVGMRGREVLSDSVSRELAAMPPAPVLIVPHDARLPRFSPTRTVEPAVAA